MSIISEENNFLSIMAWITTEVSILRAEGRNPVPFKWLLNSKEDADGLISMKSINLVKEYM